MSAQSFLQLKGLEDEDEDDNEEDATCSSPCALVS